MTGHFHFDQLARSRVKIEVQLIDALPVGAGLRDVAFATVGAFHQLGAGAVIVSRQSHVHSRLAFGEVGHFAQILVAQHHHRVALRFQLGNHGSQAFLDPHTAQADAGGGVHLGAQILGDHPQQCDVESGQLLDGERLDALNGLSLIGHIGAQGLARERLHQAVTQRLVIIARIFKLVIAQRQHVHLGAVKQLRDGGKRIRSQLGVVAGHVANIDGDGVGVFFLELAQLAHQPRRSARAVGKRLEATMKVVEGEDGNLVHQALFYVRLQNS